MTIDERLAALVMRAELMMRDLESLRAAVEGLVVNSRQDAENIRALDAHRGS